MTKTFKQFMSENKKRKDPDPIDNPEYYRKELPEPQKRIPKKRKFKEPEYNLDTADYFDKTYKNR